MNTSKQTMTINGKTFTWDVPVQVTNKKRKAPKRRWTERKKIKRRWVEEEVDESNSIKLGGKNYYSIDLIQKKRNEIATRNKISFMKSNRLYYILPAEDQAFLWDLLNYHPDAHTKKQIIKSFVYGFFNRKNFSGLLVLRKDGKLGTFSQQKSFKVIEEFFKKKEKSKHFKTKSEKNILSFLEEYPCFSLDTPVIIDEPDKEWFKEQYNKDLNNMVKAVGFVEM